MIDREALAREMWEELVEKDDRTSPKEYPDMALISFEELCNYIVAARAEVLEEAIKAVRYFPGASAAIRAMMEPPQ
jgi:hypothetical protein